MSFILTFWRYAGWEKDQDIPTFTPYAIKLVADKYGLPKTELLEAFQAWVNEGTPQGEFKYKFHDKKYLRIYHDPETFYFDGTISLTRPWGNHWRGLYLGHYLFSLDPTLKEPPQ